MHLYNLTEQYALVQAAAEDAEDGAFEVALGQLEGDISDKAENIAKIMRGLTVEAEGIRDEIDRLQIMVTTRHNQVDRLKGYLKFNLEAAGLEKVQGQLFTVALQASPPSCHVIDEAAIPTEYQRVIPSRIEIDARAIIAHWKDTGEAVPGAEVIQSKHLRVR